jgi:hypothetical protein
MSINEAFDKPLGGAKQYYADHLYRRGTTSILVAWPPGESKIVPIYVRDVTLQEDVCRIRHGRAPQTSPPYKTPQSRCSASMAIATWPAAFVPVPGKLNICSPCWVSSRIEKPWVAPAGHCFYNVLRSYVDLNR